jgi:hypothetical protein
MVAAKIFEEGKSKEFLQSFAVTLLLNTWLLTGTSLCTSKMIHITYNDKGYDEKALSLPEALVCAISARFRDLCKHKTQRTFIVDEVLGQSQVDFEGLMYGKNNQLSRVLECFLKWLYTGSAYSTHVYYHDLWYFGQMTGASGFQTMRFESYAAVTKLPISLIIMTWILPTPAESRRFR